MRTDGQFKAEILRRKDLYEKKRHTRTVALIASCSGVTLCFLVGVLVSDLRTVPPEDFVNGGRDTVITGDFEMDFSVGDSSLSDAVSSDADQGTFFSPSFPENYVICNGKTLTDTEAVTLFLATLVQCAPLPENVPQEPVSTQTRPEASDSSPDATTDRSSGASSETTLLPPVDGASTDGEVSNDTDVSEDTYGTHVPPTSPTTVFTVVTGTYRNTYRLKRDRITVNGVVYSITEEQYSQLLSLLK